MEINLEHIDTVIFDIGNVLINFAQTDYLHSFGFSEETYEHVADATFRNKDWNAGDSGLVTTEEWLTLFIENDPTYEAEIRQVFHNIGKTIIPYETTESWIQFFKEKGMRIFYLSNYSNEMYRQSKDRLTFLENFDGGIFSWKEKCMKPDEEIYKRLLKRYDIVPERAIFFDDRVENIETAQRLGMQGVVFTTDVPLQMLEK